MVNEYDGGWSSYFVMDGVFFGLVVVGGWFPCVAEQLVNRSATAHTGIILLWVARTLRLTIFQVCAQKITHAGIIQVSHPPHTGQS